MRNLFALPMLSVLLAGQMLVSANAQSLDGVAVNAWADAASSNVTGPHPSYTTGRQAYGYSPLNSVNSVPTYTGTEPVAVQSVNPNAVPSGQFKLGFGSPGPQTGAIMTALPPVSTSSVNLSICDAPPPDFSSDPYGYTGQGGGSNNAPNLPPPPGPGYQPIMQHGVFVGYMSPSLINLMQTDPTSAWTQFANSSDFVGPDGLRLSLLAETGAATPDQMSQLESMALFGM